MYAQVIVEISAKAVDKMFTYQIPKNMKDIINNVECEDMKIQIEVDEKILEDEVIIRCIIL